MNKEKYIDVCRICDLKKIEHHKFVPIEAGMK